MSMPTPSDAFTECWWLPARCVSRRNSADGANQAGRQSRRGCCLTGDGTLQWPGHTRLSGLLESAHRRTAVPVREPPTVTPLAMHSIRRALSRRTRPLVIPGHRRHTEQCAPRVRGVPTWRAVSVICHPCEVLRCSPCELRCVSKSVELLARSWGGSERPAGGATWWTAGGLSRCAGERCALFGRAGPLARDRRRCG